MKSVLVLLDRYFPKASPNAICLQNVLESLQEDDYDINIVCYDDGLSSKGYPTIKVSKGLLKSWLYRLEDKAGASPIVRLLQLVSKAKTVLCLGIWPWLDPIFTMRELRTANRAFANKDYDFVVAVYMPLSSLIVASRLKHKHPSTCYVAYFLDSLSGGYCPRFMKKTTYERKAVAWEKRVLSNADRIVFMESSRRLHERLYNGNPLEKRITYLDLPMLTDRSKGCKHKNEEEGPTLVYVGSLAPSIRSPSFILKVFSHIEDASWRIVFVGSATCEELNEYARRDKRITVVGRCAHEEAIGYEEKADVLINLGNTNPNLTPSKIFEYMSFCKKIVSTYPIDDESSMEYLKRYPASLLLDERMDAVVAARLLVEFVNKESVSFSFEDLRHAFYRNTPEATAELLR